MINRPASGVGAWELTEQERETIRATRGGGLALTCIDVHYDELQKILCKADIMTIVTAGGGSDELLATIKHHEPLLDAGEAHDTIVSTVASRHGAKALEGFSKIRQKGRRSTLSLGRATRIRSVRGGRRAGAYIEDNFLALRLFLTAREIERIGAKKGGADALEALLDCYSRLMDQGFGHADIVELASKHGGASALKGLDECGPRLVDDLGYAKTVVFGAVKRGGPKALREMAKLHTELLSWGFDELEIGVIATRHGGGPTLKAIVEGLNSPEKPLTGPDKREKPLRGPDKQEIYYAATQRNGATAAVHRLFKGPNVAVVEDGQRMELDAT